MYFCLPLGIRSPKVLAFYYCPRSPSCPSSNKWSRNIITSFITYRQRFVLLQYIPYPLLFLTSVALVFAFGKDAITKVIPKRSLTLSSAVNLRLGLQYVQGKFFVVGLLYFAKRNQTKPLRNETKRNQTKPLRNETKRNRCETKPNETAAKRNQISNAVLH